MRRPSRRRLSAFQEMALWMGEAPHKPAFHDEEEAREAWFCHRDRLLAALGKYGRRPMAWWHFEARVAWPGRDREQSVLFEAAVLTEEEAAELVAFWRQQFERAQRPDFFFCEGPGRFFSGAAARRRHYAWADIPDRLVKEWRRRIGHRPGVEALIETASCCRSTSRLASQIVGLERRVSRAGKDSIDHAPHGHDDLANCVAGAAALCKFGGYDTSMRWVSGDDDDSGAAWERARLRAFINSGGCIRL